MEALNYVWYQYRWQRIVAAMYKADGKESLVRFWNCLHSPEVRASLGWSTEALAELAFSEVSETLGRAIRGW